MGVGCGGSSVKGRKHVSGVGVPVTIAKVERASRDRSIATGEPRMVRFVHHAGCVELMRLEVLVVPVVAPNGIDRWALVFAFYF